MRLLHYVFLLSILNLSSVAREYPSYWVLVDLYEYDEVSEFFSFMTCSISKVEWYHYGILFEPFHELDCIRSLLGFIIRIVSCRLWNLILIKFVIIWFLILLFDKLILLPFLAWTPLSESFGLYSASSMGQAHLHLSQPPAKSNLDWRSRKES